MTDVLRSRGPTERNLKATQLLGVLPLRLGVKIHLVELVAHGLAVLGAARGRG